MTAPVWKNAVDTRWHPGVRCYFIAVGGRARDKGLVLTGGVRERTVVVGHGVCSAVEGLDRVGAQTVRGARQEW